jgi:hypothetical protein
MIAKETGFSGFLAPIWQEVSSLWSGAEFAFLDHSSYADDKESPSASFYDMTSTDSRSPMQAGHYGHCC